MYYAILVGVAETEFPTDDLLYVLNDVRLMEYTLRYCFPIRRIISLTDVVEYNELENAVASFNCHSDDVIFFYFSGHEDQNNTFLHFSDGNVPFQNVCTLFEGIPATKIFIIDSCYSGSNEIPGAAELQENVPLSNFITSGFAILASCRRYERSGPINVGNNIEISLFTYAVCDVIRRKYEQGNVFNLAEIASFTRFETVFLCRRYNLIEQHPTYLNNIPGLLQMERRKETVRFNYTSSNSSYRISETKDISTVESKRYAVKVIVDYMIDEQRIGELSRQVVNELYPADCVFMYWGHDDIDSCNCNWAFYSTWPASSQVCSPANGGIDIGEILVKENRLYYSVRNRIIENTANDDVLISKTKLIMNAMINSANSVIERFQQYENKDISEGIFKKDCEEDFAVIEEQFLAGTDLPIASTRLDEWADANASLAGVINDMMLIYCTDGTEDNRRALMRLKVEEYKKELTKVSEIEVQLGIQ